MSVHFRGLGFGLQDAYRFCIFRKGLWIAGVKGAMRLWCSEKLLPFLVYPSLGRRIPMEVRCCGNRGDVGRKTEEGPTKTRPRHAETVQPHTGVFLTFSNEVLQPRTPGSNLEPNPRP